MKREGRTLYNLGIAFLLVVSFIALAAAVPTFGDRWGKTMTLFEDQSPVYSYNFSANVTDPTDSTNWTFFLDYITVEPSLNLSNESSAYYWISLDNITGMMRINATMNNQTGFFNITVRVTDPNLIGESRPFYFNVSPVNDAPIWLNLTNLTFNMSDLFSRVFDVTDEENNIPFFFNATFMSCTAAEWWNSSTKGCNLFNSSHYNPNTSIGKLNVTFTPGKYDVGSYIINFTVTDSGSPNASASQIVNWTVMDVNTPPIITSICNYSVNNGIVFINASENQTFSCYINASDVGENKNLTFNFTSLSSFSSNISWFANKTIKPTNLSVNYSAFVYINITLGVRNVGNWTINISVNDSGAPLGIMPLVNSSLLRFYISNLNHSVGLNSLQNMTLSNSSGANIVSVYVNATDDDILIPDKSIYNENLAFNVTVDGIAVSWINITNYQTFSNTNITTALIQINPRAQQDKNYTINVSVTDANNYSRSSKIFTLTLKGNHAPVWSAMQTNFSYFEGNNSYLNLSANVSDEDGDNITFSYSSDTAFSSFGINSTSGIINFTSDDADVGQHLVTITATDSLAESTSLIFNFTIYNINDTPIITKPLTAANFDKNYSWNPGTNTLTIQEHRIVTINIQAIDNDLKIPAVQKIFYNESLSLSVEGISTILLNFTNLGVSGNITSFSSTFTPNVSDVGYYNITLTATDRSARTDTLKFNLTIIPLNDAPSLEAPNVTDYIYAIGEQFYIDFNTTDEEDVNESTGLLNYSIKNFSAANFISINSTTGLINITFNQSHAGGPWRFNVSVTDSGNLSASWLFNLTVYDYPRFIYPPIGYNFTLTENNLEKLNFTANHTVKNNLNFSLYIRDTLRNESNGYGNGTNHTIYLMTNYTDESCATSLNLTVNASNVKLSNTTVWNLSITHVDQPITLYQNISDQVGGSTIRVNLSEFFEDADASDECYNERVTFSVNPLSATPVISSIVSSNWQNGSVPYVVFSYSSSVTENFTITAYEYNSSNSSQLLRSLQSNNFSVRIIISEVVTPVPIPTSGSSTVEPFYLRIIVPGPVSANTQDTIILPIQLYNPSKIGLYGISLNTSIAKDGILRKDFVISLDKYYFDYLNAGESKNLTLTAKINTKEEGLYELNIYANVSSPLYSDSGKIYINVGTSLKEKLVFTEKFIVENPECLELKEMVNDAMKAFDDRNFPLAQELLQNATDACKKAVSQKSFFFGDNRFLRSDTFAYVSIASFVAFVLGIIYYYYGRIKLVRAKGFEEKV